MPYVFRECTFSGNVRKSFSLSLRQLWYLSPTTGLYAKILKCVRAPYIFPYLNFNQETKLCHFLKWDFSKANRGCQF